MKHHLEDRSSAEREADVSYLVGLSLRQLRRRQALTVACNAYDYFENVGSEGASLLSFTIKDTNGNVCEMS